MQNFVLNTTGIYTFERGNKFFELSNHLGNILVIVSDRKIGVDINGDGIIDYYVADVITAGDMYSGGMAMPGRSFTQPNANYRYSINGQEKTPEIAPNTTTAEFWQYDARIVRRWNVDPVVKELESPYVAFGNNPIILMDPNGADTIKFTATSIIQRLKGKSDGHSDNLVTRDRDEFVSNTFSISTVPKEGKDVFVHYRIIEINGVSTTTTTILKPEDGGAEGVTKGKNIYFDGLWTTERKNKDWESVGKFMNLDKDFYDYMVARNPASAFWRSQALSIAAMEGIMPTLTKSLMGAWLGFRFSGVGASENAMQYAPRVRARAVEDPVSHNFPYSFDKYILNTNPILKNNGYKIYRLPGTMHGSIKNGVQTIKSGVYEIGITKDGIIDHRFFRPSN